MLQQVVEVFHHTQVLKKQMLQLVVKALIARSPAYVWRVLRVAFSPSLILRKLALVSLLQLLAYAPQPS